MPSPVRAIVLTPPGRGAVATVRVAGQGAAAIIGRCFFRQGGHTPEEFPLDQICYGRWGGSTGEEVVVCRRPADEETIDIHCHGGGAAARAVLQSLVEGGAREVAPGGRETISDTVFWWAAPSVLQACARREIDSSLLHADRHVGPDRITLEAQAALAQAPTLRTAAILLDQWAGALLREVAEVGRRLAAADHGGAAERLKTLLDRSALGLHLTNPWRVVLAGRPNVGKSSLINALLGYQRSIVYDQPGTTRDVVTAPAALGGWPVELTDTAGLRASGDKTADADELEVAGIAKALEQIAAADLLVLVFDGTQAHSAGLDELRRRWPKALVVANKCDLPGDGEIESRRCNAVRTSALTGEGIGELAQRAAAQLVPDAPPPGTGVPFTLRQVAHLDTALAAAQIADGQAAAEQLKELLNG